MITPYHFEHNPIELIWAQVKNFIAKENKTFKMSHVKDLCMESISRIGFEEWKNYIQLVTNEVEKDNAIDNVVNSLINNFLSNSSASVIYKESVFKFIKFLATYPALSLSLKQLFFSQNFSL